jgi:hypothetical protein
MLRRITLAGFLGVVLLVGCAAPAPVLTPEEVRVVPDTDSLCQLFHNVHVVQTWSPNDSASENIAVIRAELIRRGATSESEWESTDAGKIQTGMHKCIIFALFGAPATTSVSSGVTLYQFPSGDIVIFQNGVVTSFTVANPH